MDALFYTPGEAAHVLRVATKTVYRLLVKGQIPGAFKFAGTWRIDREIFHRWLKDQAAPKEKAGTPLTSDRHRLL